MIALRAAPFEFGKLTPEFISSAFIFLGVVPLLFAVTLSLARKYLSWLSLAIPFYLSGGVILASLALSLFGAVHYENTEGFQVLVLAGVSTLMILPSFLFESIQKRYFLIPLLTLLVLLFVRILLFGG